MNIWKNPICNRTKSDVDRARYLSEKDYREMSDKEKEEFSTDLKGMLNASDISRILSNISILGMTLDIEMEYQLEPPEIITQSFVQTYIIEAIEKMRNAYMVYFNTPDTPSMPLDYKKVNDIERILLDVYTILMSNFFYVCGDGTYAGQALQDLL